MKLEEIWKLVEEFESACMVYGENPFGRGRLENYNEASSNLYEALKKICEEG